MSPDVPGHESSIEMILDHICTGYRRLTFFHQVTVAFFTLFFCVLKFGETLSARLMRPLLCVSLRHFL